MVAIAADTVGVTVYYVVLAVDSVALDINGRKS